MGGAPSVVADVAKDVAGAVTGKGGNNKNACYSEEDAKKFVTQAHDTVDYLEQLKAYKSQLQSAYTNLQKSVNDSKTTKNKISNDLAKLIAQRETAKNKLHHYGGLEGFNNLDIKYNSFHGSDDSNLNNHNVINNNLTDNFVGYIEGTNSTVEVPHETGGNFYLPEENIDLSGYGEPSDTFEMSSYTGSSGLMRYEWFSDGQRTFKRDSVDVIKNKQNAGKVYTSYGPIPDLDKIGCLNSEKANAISKYLKPIADQINVLTEDTKKINDNIEKDSKLLKSLEDEIKDYEHKQTEAVNKLKELNEKLNNYEARDKKISQLKTTVDKGKCCMKDKGLPIITSDGSLQYIKPINPEDYCGEFWDKGPACDVYHSTLCKSDPEHKDCACYSKTVLPTDNPVVALIKSNPRCYSGLCDSTKYIDSKIVRNGKCETAQVCSEDVDGAKVKNVEAHRCTPFYKTNMFIVFMILIIILGGLYYNIDEQNAVDLQADK